MIMSVLKEFQGWIGHSPGLSAPLPGKFFPLLPSTKNIGQVVFMVNSGHVTLEIIP